MTLNTTLSRNGQTQAQHRSIRRGSALARVMASFAKSRRGATAVEFAFISIPFFTLIFATLEFAMIYLVSLTLESATASAARQMRVNTADLAQGIGNTTNVTAIRNLVCSNMSWLQTACVAGVSGSQTSDAKSGGSDGLVLDVRDPASFAAASTPSPIVSGVLAQYDGSKCFYSGSQGSIVVMRAFYPWPIYTPFMNTLFPHLANGNIVIYDTEVFQIEQNGSANTATTTC